MSKRTAKRRKISSCTEEVCAETKSILEKEANRLRKFIDYFMKMKKSEDLLIKIPERYNWDLLTVINLAYPDSHFWIHHVDDPGQSYAGCDSTGDYLRWR